MPEEGMYHTTDPEIEKTTSQIRKKIHQTMQELKSQGHLIENVEAFLVNNKDMDKIHQLFNGCHGVPGGPEEGQMKMYGVKIIESPYVPEGTIFKVFKNADQMLYPVSPVPPMPISGSIQYPIQEPIKCYRPDGSFAGTSGVIPSWPLSKEQLEDACLPMTTAIDTGEVTTEQITENMKKAIEAVDKVLDEPVPKGHVPQDEERHSTKRRIELDE